MYPAVIVILTKLAVDLVKSYIEPEVTIQRRTRATRRGTRGNRGGKPRRIMRVNVDCHDSRMHHVLANEVAQMQELNVNDPSLLSDLIRKVVMLTASDGSKGDGSELWVERVKDEEVVREVVPYLGNEKFWGCLAQELVMSGDFVEELTDRHYERAGAVVLLWENYWLTTGNVAALGMIQRLKLFWMALKARWGFAVPLPPKQ